MKYELKMRELPIKMK